MASIRLHFRNYFTGDILKKGIAFLTIPIFTRMLSPAEYGIYNIFNSYISIFFIISTLNTTVGISRYAYEKTNDFNKFLGFNIIISSSLIVCSIIIILLFINGFSNVLSMPKALIYLIIPYLIFNLLKTIFEQIYQPKEESWLISKYNIFNSIITLLLKVFFIFIILEDPLIGVVTGGAIACTIFIVVYFRKIKACIQFNVSRLYFKYILQYCIPLIPYALSGIILNQFDRIMVNSYLGPLEAGLYSYAYNIGMIFSIFYRALLMRAWVPRYFHYMNNCLYDEHDEDIKKMYKVIVLGAIVLVFFGKEASYIMTDHNYFASIPVIPLIVIGYYFESVHYVYLRNAGYAKKTYLSSIVLLSAGVLNIVLNAIFIPRYGYIASAVTTFVSYLFMAIFAWFINKAFLKMHSTPLITLIIPTLLLIGSTFLYYLLESYITSFWLIFFIKMICFLSSSLFLLKKRLILFLKKLRLNR